MGYPDKYWDNVYFCICSSAMHPNTRYCTMCTEKKEGTKGRGGGVGVTDTCFLTKSLWQIGLKHSQHHKAVADMVLQSNATSSQFPHPFGLFLENKLLESKTKFQIIIIMLDSPRPSDRVLRCRPSTVQSKWQNRDKPPYRKDFEILHHAQVICMKFTLRPLLLLITTVIKIKTFYHSFLKF